LINLPRLTRPALSTPLLAIALLTWFLAQRDSVAPTAVQESGVPHVPSYYIRNLDTVTMNDQGMPMRTLQSPYVVEFLDDETTELTTPVFGVYRPDQPAWDIRSEHGWLSADGELALLSGRVTMIRPASRDTAPIKIVTSDLRIQPNNNYVETDNPVDAKSNSDHIEAVGMQGWLEQPGRIKFLSNVKARYEPRL
jgi:lipopolysaccharide export system protein LptC